MSEPITYTALKQCGFDRPFADVPDRFVLAFTFTFAKRERLRYLNLVRRGSEWAAIIASYNDRKVDGSIAIARLENMMDVRRMLLALQIKRCQRRAKLRIKPK